MSVVLFNEFKLKKVVMAGITNPSHEFMIESIRLTVKCRGEIDAFELMRQTDVGYAVAYEALGEELANQYDQYTQWSA